MEPNHYVYIYFDPTVSDDIVIEGVHYINQPFYVGMGVKNRHVSHLRKAKGTHLHKTFCINKCRSIINKGYEPIIVKIKTNLSFDEAQKLEIYLINQIGTINDVDGVKRGSLTNLTKGGEGTIGYRQSESTKSKRSETLKQLWASGDDKISKSKESFDKNRNIINNRKKSDPEYREEIRLKAIEANKREDVKIARSNAVKSVWNNEEIRSAKIAKMTEVNSSNEMRAKRSESNRKRWEDPEYRARMAESNKKRWQDPEFVAKMNKKKLERQAKKGAIK